MHIYLNDNAAMAVLFICVAAIIIAAQRWGK